MAGGAQPGLPLAVFAENIKITGNGNAAENQPALIVVDRFFQIPEILLQLLNIIECNRHCLSP